jgi:hypothetical protein
MKGAIVCAIMDPQLPEKIATQLAIAFALIAKAEYPTTS